MAELQNFRSSFNGFNREDVVHYIEYLNNKHSIQLSQLKNETAALRSELERARTAPGVQEELEAQLNESRETCTALEAEVASLKEQLAQASQAQADQELEAYRRAERVERMAQQRAQQMYDQASAILADATVRVDEAAAQIGDMAQQVACHLGQFQNAVTNSKQALSDAAAAMYALKPQE